MTGECKTCRFWHMDPNWSRKEGECHIRSPQVVVDADGGSPYAVWPPTRATGWCGEHQPKPIDNTTGTEQSAEYAAYLASLNRGVFEVCWTKRGEHEPKPIDTTADTEQPIGVSVGDYVLATKWPDGDPGDQWCVGFVSEYWPYKRRWQVVDSDGKNFRHNGFRRVERITAEVGERILEIMSAGANPPSMWGLRDIVQAGVLTTPPARKGVCDG